MSGRATRDSAEDKPPVDHDGLDGTTPGSGTLDARPGAAEDAEVSSSPVLASPAAARAAGDLGRGASIGRYLVLSVLGRGGMGEVYAAYDPELDRRVALKLLHTAGGTESARKRLLREARALGKLSHPNVVQVHDVGEHQGDVFLAMELVEGQSLKDWCKSEPKPRFRQVLAAYLEAALGLAAAHQKGLIHRDIKPANILRGKDGRVRVADFGLAAGHEPLAEDGGDERDAADEPPGETPSSSSGQEGGFDERLTATGALMGTPAFMSPEQARGREVGTAADQYSLCVALYEGLYGVLPFSADADAEPLAVLLQLYQRKMHDPPAPPPVDSPVPAWVHKALGRGLSPAPEDRYPSLEALIAALSDDPDARRRARRRVMGAAAGAMVLASVALAGWVQSGVFRDPCGALGRELAGVWDETVKGRVRAALLGTQRSHAGTTAERVAAVLDRYAGQWVGMRTEVCRAFREETGEQRKSVLNLRDVCLLRRRGQLRALTEVLASGPDTQVLDKAVQAAEGLYPIAYCADEKALTARVPPPEDPAIRARVETLQPRVDCLEALRTAGKYKQGLAEGGPLLAEVEGLTHTPLRAQAMFWVGRLREGDGDYDGASSMLREALFLAAQGKDEVLATRAAGWLLLVVGNRQQRFDQARALMEWAPLVVDRTDDGLAQAEWLTNLAGVLRIMGRYEEAKAQHERSLAIWEKALGPDHPDVALALTTLGRILVHGGELDAAAGRLQRALSIYEKTLGKSHPFLAAPLLGLGELALARGAPAEAAPLLERALSFDASAVRAEVLLALANTLWAVGKDRPRAIALATQARENAARIGHEPHLAKVTRWLAKHQLP
jgi:serine/threonine-protein kinase